MGFLISFKTVYKYIYFFQLDKYLNLCIDKSLLFHLSTMYWTPKDCTCLYRKPMVELVKITVIILKYCSLILVHAYYLYSFFFQTSIYVKSLILTRWPNYDEESTITYYY